MRNVTTRVPVLIRSCQSLLILHLDGSSFVRPRPSSHRSAWRILRLALAAREISQTRIFLRSIGYGLSQSDPASVAAVPTLDQLRLVPASTAVPAAAAKQQNEKYNDEKRGGIHVRFPRCCVLRSLKFWTSDNVLAGRPVPGIHVAR
jgi:hypothetical protein